MNVQKFEKLKKWTNQYIDSFYCDDDFLNANYELKQAHTARVCEEMLYLTNSLSFEPHQEILAQAIALLHDIGRFEQFKKYRTYSDCRSIKHSELGLKVIAENKLLENIDHHDKLIIEKAIEYHSMKEIPENVDSQVELYSKLIRDADKIDIFYVVIAYYEQYLDDPDSFRLELELPDIPEYSAELIDSLLNGERFDYQKLKSWNDMKLLQLGWVYDMNFTATFTRLKERKYIQAIADFLPENEDIQKAIQTVLKYVDDRINLAN